MRRLQSVKIFSPLACVILNGLCQLTYAGDSKLVCPESINSATISANETGNSWTLQTDKQLRLTSAGFMAGPPESKLVLIETTSSQTKTTLTENWKFVGPYPNGKWLVCYFEQGLAGLSKRIGDDKTECSIVYQKLAKRRFQLRYIKCK
jgi:hypothetical protein